MDTETEYDGPSAIVWATMIVEKITHVSYVVTGLAMCVAILANWSPGTVISIEHGVKGLMGGF